MFRPRLRVLLSFYLTCTRHVLSLQRVFTVQDAECFARFAIKCFATIYFTRSLVIAELGYKNVLF